MEIDHIYEPERLVKIPGTLSTKGDRALWRVARFLDDEDTFKDGSSVLRAILSQGVSQAPLVAPTAEELGVKSKSEAQFAMATFLKAKGYKAEQALATLRNSPYGKANRDDDNVRIVQKVFSGRATVTNGRVEEKQVQVYTLQGAMDEYKRRKAERANQTVPELPLGFRALDQMLWGLRRGNILTIGARTGVGKTALALNVASSVGRVGKRVLFFSTEMPVGEIVDRIVTIQGGHDADLAPLDIRVCDESAPNVESVKIACEQHKPDLVVFDYVQHTGDSTGDNRYRELSLFIRGFHDVVREFDCAGVLLSQLNRVAESEPPTLTSLSECGVLENESSAVILMHRLMDNPDAKEVPLMLNVAKNRHGARGTCTLLFKPEEMKFIEQL
ncbi:MAG: AAA family ATPase [Chloracidobacterium sp.]|nr:AAA family ATPase [Chloracidobacterium sp.]